MKTILTLSLLGIAAGLIGALCGVGGGIILVPALTQLLHFEEKQAIATSLAIVVITAMVASINNARAPQLIQWQTVLIVAISSSVSAWWGSEWMKQLSNATLSRTFAVVMILVGVRMLLK